MISSGLATMHELDTVYGTQDMWDLMEIGSVDRYNQSISQQD